MAKLSFKLCRERVDFCFSSPIAPYVPTAPTVYAIPMAPIILTYVFGINLFDGEGIL